MSSYDPHALCRAAAQILLLSTSDTTTKTAMKCAGFKSVDAEYITYRKRIERQRNQLKLSHPSQITVQEESLISTSSLSNCTDIAAKASRIVVLSCVSIIFETNTSLLLLFRTR